MNSSVLLRSRRKWLAALACVTIPMLCSAVHALTISATGNPVPPTTVALNATYQITVQGIPDYNNYIRRVDVGSASGNADGPTNSFTNHGIYQAFSNTCNATVQHTFSVVNQGTGYYWWQAGGTEVVCNGGASVSALMEGLVGYYYTPNPPH